MLQTRRIIKGLNKDSPQSSVKISYFLVKFRDIIFKFHALGVQAVIGRLQEDSVHLLKLVVHLLGLLTQGIPSDATKLKLSQLVEIQSCLQKILQRIIHKRVKMMITVDDAQISMGIAGNHMGVVVA